ncbi:MAG: hypothetical protein L0H53_08160 [Candidatus Nitrosocosmicus sp.]|nr:hypothetical protein [Candidatus Nitrosocosmicus sp.]MDN5868682.1 hypothetical protein [Candidatus Nitrosocosmicus sp.]
MIKTKPIHMIIIASLFVALMSSSYIYSAYSVDDYFPYVCSVAEAPEGKVVCCTTEISTGNMWCTTCDDTNPPSNCSQRELQMKEQPPTTDDQPTKSGDSVFPNEDGKAVDDSNPKSPLTDQRALPSNEGVLEQSDDSSNNQDNNENVPSNGEVLRE